MNLTLWCNRIIRTGFYLLFILVPLVLTPWNYELFEYNKMMLTYGITVVILAAWIVKMMHLKEVKIAKTPLDIPIVLFVLSQLLSAIFSMDRHVSWFGYYSRFNGGMLSVFTYVTLFYAFVTNMADDIKQIPRICVTMVKILLGTAAVVALYGVAEHFGIDKTLWVQDVQSRVFSTLGQPNWLAAYLVAFVPLGAYFAIINQPFTRGKFIPDPKKIFLSVVPMLVTVVFFLTVLYTRSRSGLLGLATADIVFWLLLYTSYKEKKVITIPFVLLHAAFAIVIFVNGLSIEQVDKWVSFQGWANRLTHVSAPAPTPQPAGGTMLEAGGTESGTIRKYVWQGALNAWRSSTKTKLIGTGTETFAFAFYQHRPKEHNLTSEWDFLYNKAHNEYLNFLATTGVFGLGSYLLFIGTFIWWFLKIGVNASTRQRENNNDAYPASHTLSFALFAGWTSILVTNFFGFSVVVIQTLFFLIPAIVLTLAADKSYRIVDLRRYQTVATVIMWAASALGILALIILSRFWQADTLYATGYRMGRSGDFGQAQILDTQAISLNLNEPLYHDELASTLGSLTISAIDQKNATLAAELAKRALAQSDIALQISPNNVNFWKTRTKLFYSFSSFDPKLNAAAIEALEKAQTLSPRDPKILYNLAILYGRDADNDTAIVLLTKAKELKPNYRDAYFGLYVFYTELNKPDMARAELQFYLDHVDPTDKDFLERVK